MTTQKQTLCDSCGSKIYPGDTIYIVEKQNFCESCTEVVEYERAFCSDC
jgi:ribosomal protein L24E